VSSAPATAYIFWACLLLVGSTYLAGEPPVRMRSVAAGLPDPPTEVEIQ
jgi:hypothetical protein